MNYGRRGFRSKAIEALKLFLLAAAYFGLHIFNSFLSRRGLVFFNGVVQSFQLLIVLFMLFVNSRKGRHLGWACLLISEATLIPMVLHGAKAPIPGIFNISVFLIVLTILSYQFENLDKRVVADYITGLNNSRGLMQVLKLQIFDKKPFFVIYIELENFKSLNDNYGFDCGDELRRIVTGRLKPLIRGHGTLGCIDRSSFMMILDGDCDARQVAAEALNVIGQKVSVKIGGDVIDCYTSAYAGIASYPNDADDAQTLMKYSDIAMYHASISKTERIVFYEPQMEDKLKRQVEVEKIIKKALANDNFYLVYQPQFSSKDKKLRGFEALLRMQEVDGQRLFPGEFIPAAEKNDLILEITDWVLNDAMKTFAPLVRGTDVKISINASSKNMESETFVGTIKTLLEQTDFPAQNLEIEITEYCLLQSFEKTIKNINALRELGVQVALDDFGTGYTSLSYLEKLPIDLLKVDKSLVDTIEQSQKSQQFMRAVIHLGHLMGCDVICEGVETQSQLDFLKAHDSDFIQGYIWGKPLEFEKALEVLRA